MVPGAPGGTLDNPARILAKHMGEALGKPMVVVNKAGSAGIIGTQAALAAPADGYTLLVGTSGRRPSTTALTPSCHTSRQTCVPSA